MATMSIYKHNINIDMKTFEHNFYICYDQNKKELFWETGEEQASKKPLRRGGTIYIWIQGSIAYQSHISAVPPDWKVYLDNIPLPQTFHHSLLLVCKSVQLLFEEYQFVCILDDKRNI